MDNNEIFAKSNPPESIQIHNKKLIENYEYLKKNGFIKKTEKFDIEKYDNAIKKILYYHDLGKLNTKFQNKIRKKLNLPLLDENQYIHTLNEIPHEWLSLCFISDEDIQYFKSLNHENIKFDKLVQYCIAFHHNRDKIINQKTIEKFIKYDIEKNKIKIGIKYPLRTGFNIDNGIRKKIEDNFEEYFDLLVFIKGLLHKCDYAASANIEIEKLYKGNYKNDFINKGIISKKWELKDFQKKAEKNSNKNIILVASTGMGKTEFAMNWIQGHKAFYLLGIKTAVYAMYERFKEIFSKDNVSLLYGDTEYYIARESDDEIDYLKKSAMVHQLSYPITIATADQLVTSVFKFKGFEFFYFTLSYSYLIVDEIQSFSPEAIASIVVFLKEIKNLGAKFLLMTATLPEFIKKEFNDINDLVYIRELSNIKRHKISMCNYYISDELSIQKIKETFQKNNKILVICNTIKMAQEMREKLKELNPSLIHSRFIFKDRKLKEEDILKASDEKNLKSIWISTQVVEASLNIDFDFIFTECATIDSIFQRMGRCWRKKENDYNYDYPNIFIFKPSENSYYVYDREILNRTFEVLMEYDKKLLTEEEKQRIISQVFDFNFIKNTKYYENYKMSKNLLKFGFRAESKNEAQKMFRKITNNYTIIPEPVFNKFEEKIKRNLDFIDNPKNNFFDRLKSKLNLQQYCISTQLDENKIKNLLKTLDSNYAKKKGIFILKGVEYDNINGLKFLKEYKDLDNII